MPRSPKIILKGEKALLKKLKRLSNRRAIKKVVRQATNAAGQEVVKGVRRIWNAEAKDTGLSARSVTKKIISTKAGFEAIIGIDKEAVGVARGKTHVPSNIDHLIEFGYQHANGTTVPAVAPLRRGYEASKDAAMAKFQDKATQAIEKEAAKN